MHEKKFSIIALSIGAVALVLSIYATVSAFNYSDETKFNTKVEQGIDAYVKKQQAAAQAAAEPPAPAGPVDVSMDDDAVRGDADAPVTIVIFSEYQCPFCGAAEGTNQQVMDYLKSKDPSWEAPLPKLESLIEEGKVKLVFRDYIVHETARKAAEATECADEQGKFWEMHDKLFLNQDALAVDNLKSYAQELGLDTAKFNSCLDNGDMADEVKNDSQEGASYGVNGTPAFFINGRLLSGAQSFSAFEKIIEAELSK